MLTSLSLLIQIRRIQNKSLYLLYKAEKERLDRVNKRKDNEKILWHGTATDKEKYIISDGFNRSHAGDTFGKKVFMYASFSIAEFPDPVPSFILTQALDI